MSGTTILISPLNWGFGHAGRMIPLALELSKRGNTVIFGADAGLLPLIANELPGIRLIEIPGLRIRYSRVLPQYLSILLQLPMVACHAVREHRHLIRLAEQIRPSVIISDNRFGFYHRKIFSVYVTHQVRIPFPRLLRFMEPAAAWLHRWVIRRYNLCLVPDYPGPVNLSGRLSHGLKLPGNLHYMGPLSRFRMPVDSTTITMPADRMETMKQEERPDVRMLADQPGVIIPSLSEGRITLPEQYCCLILSGPEPQHSLLFEKVVAALPGIHILVLSATPVQTARESIPGITFIINPDTGMMSRIIKGSSLVITRAGYTSVMELASIGKGAVIIPAPGQTEQEYLGSYLNGNHGFVSVRQNKIKKLFHPDAGGSAPDQSATSSFPDSTLLFEKAIKLLSEQNIQ